MSVSRPVGFGNYARLIFDPRLAAVYRNTALFAFVSIGLTVGLRLQYPAALGRLQGYPKALKQVRVPVDPEHVRTRGWWQDDGYEHALALLQLKQIPTAIFCASVESPERARTKADKIFKSRADASVCAEATS